MRASSNLTPPEIGQIVSVRQKKFVVTDIQESMLDTYEGRFKWDQLMSIHRQAHDFIRTGDSFKEFQVHLKDIQDLHGIRVLEVGYQFWSTARSAYEAGMSAATAFPYVHQALAAAKRKYR